LPLIIVLNHPSWWDPLIGAVLARLYPDRAHFAPMESRALARYNLFDNLGFYGVEQNPTRGGIAFLRTTLAILSRPNAAVCIAAQGAFTDARVRPPRLQSGIGHVAARMRKGTTRRELGPQGRRVARMGGKRLSAVNWRLVVKLKRLSHLI
jgi:hypothetical protein